MSSKAANITLRFNNATSTHDKTVVGWVTPKQIRAYGRVFKRESGIQQSSRFNSSTNIRVLSYAVPGQPEVTFADAP
jgi:hypothetical protein